MYNCHMSNRAVVNRSFTWFTNSATNDWCVVRIRDHASIGIGAWGLNEEHGESCGNIIHHFMISIEDDVMCIDLHTVMIDEV